MKYFFAIALLFLSVSAFTAYRLLLPHDGDADRVYLEINGRKVCEDEYLRLRDEAKKKSAMGEEFNESVITRALLIQEAQRQQLDKEECFRRSIQNYYEQSLIKILTDRKMAELENSVTDEEITAFERLLPSTLNLVRLPARSFDEASAGKFTGEERMTMKFVDLATPMQLALLGLTPGKTTQPLAADGNGYIVYRLESVEPWSGEVVEVPSREGIRSRLEKARHSLAMDRWLQELRRTARVVVHAEAQKR